MTLASGTNLGPYEILAPIGAGGMGEVYKARDTRLERIVAIKLLPKALMEDTDRRLRFEREARAVSALNHPHICTLYDVGEGYLVMEYIEGEPLRGPVPTAEALRLAVQIADALDHAHRRGIMHRDLKPGNILVTKAGAKLLDFGLAKIAVRPGSSDSKLSQPLTTEGAVMGTFQYMAPEQLEGRESDARADLYTFGALLYELITGERAFDQVRQGGLRTLQPAALDRVVKKCLVADPDLRWQTATDLRDDLRWVAETPPPAAPRPRQVSWRWKALVAALAASTLLAAAAWILKTPPAPKLVRLSMLPQEKAVLHLRLNSGMALSPDGSHLAFVATLEGRSQLWVRTLDSLAARPLASTDGAAFPFWSPDSRSIAFFATGKLKRADLSGGPPQAICDTPAGRGGAWNPEGTILFAPGADQPLQRVPAAGGKPVPVPGIGSDTLQSWPWFLPDGKHFLYSVRGKTADSSGLFVASLDASTKPQRLSGVNSNAVFAPIDANSGHVLLLRDTILLAQRLNTRSWRLEGEPSQVADGVGNILGLGPFSVSRTGVLVHGGGVFDSTQLTWRSRDGKLLEIVGQAGTYIGPRLSPDGARLAVGVMDASTGRQDIWMRAFTRTSNDQYTFGPQSNNFPVWSPDGSRLAWSRAGEDGRSSLFQKAATGVGQEERLAEPAVSQSTLDWSGDGRFLLHQISSHGDDIWVLPLTGDRKPFPFVETQYDELHGQFSPDGRWIAYSSNGSGQGEVFVQTFPATGGKWMVSSGGGTHPRWRGDSKELFYVSTSGKMMAVPVTGAGAALETGPAALLFETRLPGHIRISYHYDVTRDGQRFLLLEPVQSAAQALTVVLNWQAALKGR